MIKKIQALLAILLLLTTKATASANEWTLYPSYHNATYCEVAGDRVYVLASGALYSYDTSDNEVRVYDKITTLSDIDITHIRYSGLIDGLIIIYSNANIDILYDDESLYNISDFKNKILPGKTINNIDIQGSTAYLSTEFGIVVLDLENLEFSNTYNIGLNTYSTCLFNNALYAGTSSGVYRCNITDNMLDKNNWKQLNNNSTEGLCTLGGRLYCLNKATGINTLDPNDGQLKTIAKSSSYHGIYSNGNEIIAPGKSKTTIIDSNNKIFTYNTGNNLHTAKKGERYWDCKGYDGVVEYKITDNKVDVTANYPHPDSPKRNYCEYMKTTGDGRLLVAGGNINYFDKTFYDGTVMQFDCNKQEWFIFPEDTIRTVTGLKYLNICSVDEDPTEPGHFFASSFGYGIYEFRDGKFINHYNHLNSPLESPVANPAAASRYVRVPSVQFDNEGNLWCVNSDVKGIVKVLMKDGSWQQLEYKDIEYMATMSELYLDSRGWLWVVALQGDPGLFCAKTNGTPFDTSDDITRKWTHKFTNQDGISYDIYQLYDIAEDRDGQIWVGTNIGVFVIDNPEKFFNDGIFRQIKIARNDGTGLADYFMSGVYIKDIEVDGANRKWIGTNNNGIYLVSADGQETIHHFTTENSPLPSDCIESIAINHTTGEVFIGTDKGIASYKGNATTPAESLEKDNIHAYPNPVRADYNGNISIVGLTFDSNVKIVDAAGYLINEGQSNGGQYSWNGRNIRGEKVASGVYHVLVYDSEGNEAAATKILITR